jgi:hypothetical protein
MRRPSSTRKSKASELIAPRVSTAMGKKMYVDVRDAYLGDETLTFCDHINDIVRACNYHMQALCHIRRYMSADVARTVGFSIVGSRVDYCNALLYGAGA